MDKYPEYKNSEIEWMEKVPKHWTLKRFKDIGFAKTGLTYSPENISDGQDTDFLVLRSTNIKNGFIQTGEGLNVYVNKKINTELFARKNDIIICTRNGSQKLVGKSGILKEDKDNLTFGAFTCRYRSNYNNYIYYLINSELMVFERRLTSSSTIFQLTNKMINNFKFYFPTEKEQTAIAHFLDNKVGATDNSKEALQKQKELLIEERKALIHNSVTQGLDPDVPMKDSGVEWIGMVPEHWSIRRIGNLFSIRSQKGFDDKEPLSTTHYAGVIPQRLSKYRVQQAIQSNLSSFKLVKIDDFVLSFSSWQTGIEISKYDGVISPAYTIMYQKKLNNDFLKYLFKDSNFITEIAKDAKGIRVGRDIPFSKIKYVQIAFPNNHEQQKIVDYLDKKTAKIDEAIAEIDRQIALLQEYKKTLINDAVTGKIKVYEGEL